MFFYKFPSKVGIQASSPDLSPTTPAQAAQTEPREPLQPVKFWGRSTSGTALLLFWVSLAFNTPFSVFTKSSFPLTITSLCTSSKKVPKRKEHSISFLQDGYICIIICMLVAPTAGPSSAHNSVNFYLVHCQAALTL